MRQFGQDFAGRGLIALALSFLAATAPARAASVDAFGELERLTRQLQTVENAADRKKLTLRAALLARVLGEVGVVDKLLKQATDPELVFLKALLGGIETPGLPNVASLDAPSRAALERWLAGGGGCRDHALDPLLCAGMSR